MLAVGDEGLGAVEDVAVAGSSPRVVRTPCRSVPVPGSVMAMAPTSLAGRKLRQPAFLLLLGAVAQDIGRDDAGMQRRAEGIEAAEATVARLITDLMGEGAAAAAIFLGIMAHSSPALPALVHTSRG